MSDELVTRIQTTLGQIAEILSRHGHKEKANWLLRRGEKLDQARSPSEEREIILEVKGIMAGMGSLSDIYLSLPNAKRNEEIAVNRSLQELIDELDGQLDAALAHSRDSGKDRDED